MSKYQIYLDTSVISAYFDYKKPIRQLITQKWIENESKDYDILISTLVIDEINKNNNETLKNEMFKLINNLSVNLLEIDENILKLSKEYRKIILSNEINDTIHIATASYNKIKAIISWNFRHIVNLKTIEKIHEVNIKKGYPIIEIISLENIGGFKYGNI
jgi:predicted nucleic acid-binding protein